jgi:hypothetical protein
MRRISPQRAGRARKPIFPGMEVALQWMVLVGHGLGSSSSGVRPGDTVVSVLDLLRPGQPHLRILDLADLDYWHKGFATRVAGHGGGSAMHLEAT